MDNTNFILGIANLMGDILRQVITLNTLSIGFAVTLIEKKLLILDNKPKRYIYAFILAAFVISLATSLWAYYRLAVKTNGMIRGETYEWTDASAYQLSFAAYVVGVFVLAALNVITIFKRKTINLDKHRSKFTITRCKSFRRKYHE